MHVVLIETDLVAAFLIERQLRRVEAISSFASFHTPAEAVPYLAQQAAQGTPLIVLLGLHQPLMRGWGDLDALAPYVEERCRVYVLLAALWPEEVQRLQQHPLVTGVLHKPLDSEQLHGALAAVYP